ncbi:MAG: CHAD domain-containing protein [Synechococcaceae cyanobacterium]|nr:CHAD domain-containing protein [Synechococcaceae cyanobacterium]
MDVLENTSRRQAAGHPQCSSGSGVETVADGAQPAAQPAGLSSGRFAQALIQHQVRRVGQLQAEVLADLDPEPLHQMRVSLRRLRTAIGQFAPALELPNCVRISRIAAVARCTSLCRDLDVMKLHLGEKIMPRLPKGASLALTPVIRQIEQERERAFETVIESLHSSPYLKLLTSLDKWQKRPRFTALGELPLTDWLYEWQEPFTAGLFLHPGWMCNDPDADAVHELRKRIKGARYSLEALDNWISPELKGWIKKLRQAQDHLVELRDLQILSGIIIKYADAKKSQSRRQLMEEIQAGQCQHWLQWRQLADQPRQNSSRQALRSELLLLGHRPAEQL